MTYIFLTSKHLDTEENKDQHGLNNLDSNVIVGSKWNDQSKSSIIDYNVICFILVKSGVCRNTL